MNTLSNEITQKSSESVKTQIEYYLIDIENINGSDLKKFEEKLVEIVDFIKDNNIISSEFSNKIKYFDDLFKNNEIMKNLIDDLKNETISVFEELLPDDATVYNKALEEIFNCTHNQEIANQQDFIQVLKENDRIWTYETSVFYEYWHQVDFSEKKYKGFLGINYPDFLGSLYAKKEKIPTLEKRLLGEVDPDVVKIAISKGTVLKEKLDQFYDFTIVEPKKNKIREFQYIEYYYDFLSRTNQPYNEFNLVRYENKRIYMDDNSNNELQFVPEPQNEKINYLKTVLRTLNLHIINLQEQQQVKPQKNLINQSSELTENKELAKKLEGSAEGKQTKLNPKKRIKPDNTIKRNDIYISISLSNKIQLGQKELNINYGTREYNKLLWLLINKKFDYRTNKQAPSDWKKVKKPINTASNEVIEQDIILNTAKSHYYIAPNIKVNFATEKKLKEIYDQLNNS